MALIFRTLICLFLLTGFLSAQYIESEAETEAIQATLVSEDESIQPGHPFWVAIRLNLKDHWHTYWKNPGDAGMPVSIEWSLPPGFEAASIHWPTPKRLEQNGSVGFGYEEEAVFLAQITPPASLEDAYIDMTANVRWIACSDAFCVPGNADVSLSMPIGAHPPTQNKNWQHLFTKARALLPKKSVETFSALRLDDFIEVAIPKGNKEFDQAYFFSEEKQSIDHKVNAVLAASDKPGYYNLILKEDKKAPALKGVLVLQNKEEMKSYAVDIPITPKSSTTELIGMVDSAPALPESDLNFTAPEEFEGGLVLALIMAFAGGMILNLMPCVLPVLSFKVLSFIKMAGKSRALIVKHGVFFAIGVLLSFWILAGALLMMQTYGRSVGWGFQLQEPLFVAILSSVLFIFGLSLFGLFEIGVSLTAIAGQAQSDSSKNGGLVGSFFSGILATAVATPCTGPFLGSAVGFAVTLPAAQSLLIFTFLGLGMSAPYLLFALFPNLLRFMPKPGAWMVTFKEIMGFFMLATVLWLVWVFAALTSSFALVLLLSAYFFLGIGGWIFGKWGTPMRKKSVRIMGYLIALGCISTAGYFLFESTTLWAVGQQTESNQVSTDHGPDAWEEFSPERVAQLRQQGIPVFVDFTAKWCLTCQTNHWVLTTNEVSQKFSQLGVVKMKADWTKSDPIITAELRKFGRNSVPLYVLYSGDSTQAPHILPQLLTQETVLDYLRKIES